MCPLMAKLQFIQDEVGEKKVMLWDINSLSKYFLIMYFNVPWQKDKAAHRSKIVM